MLCILWLVDNSKSPIGAVSKLQRVCVAQSALEVDIELLRGPAEHMVYGLNVRRNQRLSVQRPLHHDAVRTKSGCTLHKYISHSLLA